MTAITLAAAQLALAAGIAEAERLGVKVSVAVVDAGGVLRAFARMDGGELFGLQANGRGRYVMFGGGLPATDGDSQVIGAVGVSGAAVAEDVACAEAARAALTGAA